MAKKLKIIIGLGKTGLSVVRHLHQQGDKLIVMDSRPQPPNLSDLQIQFPEIPIHCGSFPRDILFQADEIIISPGIALSEPAIHEALVRQISICGDIELFVRQAQAPIIGITGTNAKGTVTTLVGEMINATDKKALVGGNIGIPALDLLNLPVPDYYVMELSSFQLETTQSLKTAAATILNVSPDHLDRHITMQNYIAAKQKIYFNAKAIIVNRDDAATFPESFAKPECLFSYGLSAPPSENAFGLIQNNNQTWLAFGGKQLMNVEELFIKGTHNWANALAALALGSAINLPMSVMLQSLANFKGLKHRCEYVCEKNGIVWYDDSKGTNVGATLAALQGLGPTVRGKIIWIAGGLGKGADFTALRGSVIHYVREAILFGQDAHLLDKALQNTVSIKHVADLAAAVNHAWQTARPGDSVLLSPACASWDMFRDYEQRGDMFKELARSVTG